MRDAVSNHIAADERSKYAVEEDSEYYISRTIRAYYMHDNGDGIDEELAEASIPSRMGRSHRAGSYEYGIEVEII